MPNEKTDSTGFSTTNADQERDIAGKGGPATGAGTPDSKHGVSSPYDADLQTQIAAKSTKPGDEDQQATQDEEDDNKDSYPGNEEGTNDEDVEKEKQDSF